MEAMRGRVDAAVRVPSQSSSKRSGDRGVGGDRVAITV